MLLEAGEGARYFQAVVALIVVRADGDAGAVQPHVVTDLVEGGADVDGFLAHPHEAVRPRVVDGRAQQPS